MVSPPDPRSHQSKNDAQAWSAIFAILTHSRPGKRYRVQGREKTAIKANLEQYNRPWHNRPAELVTPFDPFVVRSWPGWRVPQPSITVFDSSRWIPGRISTTKFTTNFPASCSFTDIGGDGGVCAEFKPNAIPFSVPSHNATGLDTTAVEAAYLIDAAGLRAHVSSGVTLCANNLLGATSIYTDWRKNAHDGFHHTTHVWVQFFGIRGFPGMIRTSARNPSSLLSMGRTETITWMSTPP